MMNENQENSRVELDYSDVQTQGSMRSLLTVIITTIFGLLMVLLVLDILDRGFFFNLIKTFLKNLISN